MTIASLAGISIQNVPAAVSNPEAGCKYYEQYCIDDDRFRLGRWERVVACSVGSVSAAPHDVLS